MNSPNAARGLLVGGGGPPAPEICGITRRSLAKTCCLRRWRMVRQYVASDIMLNISPAQSTAHLMPLANRLATPPVQSARSFHVHEMG
jgi:hypothetical protein